MDPTNDSAVTTPPSLAEDVARGTGVALWKQIAER
ncbi:MAG: phosphonate metabolism transcriptional regulator PhnF, partial [Starkeya sp.]|nr:phosphonate metabolism transcriptional regulator PhnF [Starkeya sp.]